MSSISATIVGRLARDPESRTTGNGTQLVTCTIPTESGWGDNKTTTWWRVTMFGKRADIVAKHLTKGKWARFTGDVCVREYTKKDGTKGFSAEMTADSFSFVGNKSDNGDGGGYNRTPANPRNPKPRQAPAPMTEAEFDDEDLPF